MAQVFRNDLLYAKERYAILGAAMAVFDELGNGYVEPIYQDALELEFRARGIPYEREKELHVQYKGQQVKHYYKADFVCYGKIIVELKAVSSLNNEHLAQTINYLKTTGMELALLANFGSNILERKWLICSRVHNTITIQEQR